MAKGFGTQIAADPGSFRDRSNRVFLTEGRVLRALDATASQHWRQVVATTFYKTLQQSGHIVGTKEVGVDELGGEWEPGQWETLLEHETIPAITYPYEWPFSMLKAAALLTLDLQAAALAEGYILKDATPYNIQWVGAQPKLIDVVSFEPYQPGSTWAGQRQFYELFLYPLMLQSFKGVPYHTWLRGSIDGITAEQFLPLLSMRDRFRKGVLVHVALQSRLQKSLGSTNRDIGKELKSSGFGIELLKVNVRRLKKLVQGLALKNENSVWRDYAETLSYTNSEYEQKKKFITEIVAARTWPTVWDLGCNTGDFSKIAAASGSYVLSVDADQMCVERLFRDQHDAGGTSILPLVMQLNDPSPGIGWRGRERAPLESRSTPDLVFFLALIHHMVITANIPLPSVFDWLASLKAGLVIEFVSKQDEMVQQLLRNRLDQFGEYSPENFEQCLKDRFSIENRLVTKPGKREIFFLLPKAGT